MKKIVLCICSILLIVNMFEICDAAEKRDREKMYKYIGIYRHQEVIRRVSKNRVNVGAYLIPKDTESFSKIVIRVVIKDDPGRIKWYDKSVSKYYSKKDDGYILSKKIKLLHKGKCKLSVEYKCYKNGRIIEKLVANPVYEEV